MALREALEAAVNTAEGIEAPVTQEKAEVTAPVETEVKVEATETQEKAGRTAGRPRDEHGRLLPGKAEKSVEKPAEKEAQVEQVSRPPRPSSWKKEMWEHYDKLDPKVAEYVNQREQEFAKGVSTYKQDYDRLKPVGEVIAQHEAFLRQQNIRPEQLVSNLMTADQTLRFGSPKDKLSLFAKLATDYQIPIHEMLVQGEDGKVYFNKEYFQPQAQQPQGLTTEQARKIAQEEFNNRYWLDQIKSFQEAKDDKGNLLYPHFETVRKDMDGILRLGQATDLKSAYTKALRLHDDIWEAEQKAKSESALKAEQEAKAKAVGKAKSTAVSPKTATPSSETPAKGKGIRANLEKAFEAQETGRV